MQCKAVFALVFLLQIFWTTQGDECCWCGKRYFEGTPSLPPEAYTGISGVQIAVSADKSFYVASLDQDPVTLIVLTPSEVKDNLAIQVRMFVITPQKMFCFMCVSFALH
jgi:hypothetical protein